mmetsp:Transcript_21845/g.40188  ORF Transcript_21845/g.40188 Transcript_21845/m.40188 type:complete len:169 (+) Transcript_21845:119-625(+)
MQVSSPIVCVAFVGSDGFQQCFRRYGQDGDRSSLCQADDLELQFALFCALDQVETQLRVTTQAIQRGETRPMEPYLGLLTPALLHAEDYNIYGFVAATSVKILATVREGLSKQRGDEDQMLKQLFQELHALHVAASCNPFLAGYSTESFTKAVDKIVEKHNQPTNWTL